MKMLLGIDIGTTNCKAAVFDVNGKCMKIASRPTKTHYRENGQAFYHPDEIWEIVSSNIEEAIKDFKNSIAVIGITSMAETGLLIDKRSGLSKTEMIPWFDKRAMEEAEFIVRSSDPIERFSKSGLRPSFKYGLPKLLWLKQKDSGITNDAIWLSASDFIAYKLTGEFGTDYSLAARTYGFRIDEKTWDVPWLNSFGLEDSLFPDAHLAGTPIGEVSNQECIEFGLSKGTPVAVSGHDHVCAALAVGAVNPETVLDSMGTAETLVGAFKERKLGEKEYRTGLSYGCHVVKNRNFWMGGNPSSGGSIEWMRSQLSDTQLTYDEMLQLLAETSEGPSGILYFPYLSGSGAPNPNPYAKAAFIGLEKNHGKKDIIKSILEGTAYQLKLVQKSAEEIAGKEITKVVAVGGGTKNKYWMQIKADVSGCSYSIPDISESTLLGAAMAAGIGSGIYRDEQEAIDKISSQFHKEITPNEKNQTTYQEVYTNEFLKMEELLRNYYQKQ
ncbi:L-fuculokinase [Lederbergia wuyishanensis]|uniref:Xylulokinase n=1 Tax=Lederbergia wuyishanensis TaxID=1347903 RepID=A0ABU0D954_9BACI|nr:FGGY family carbohydrate kinase [Lederbergia wuyishanensis]MCJ8009480.1 FGGY family carbohydrate kinase [Lederbergia wuyishanensis]MDQ0344910.1 xylulokinase [Lederbergia wuyishanensis]